MTRREAAIVSAYSGILIGSFVEFHDYVEEIMGRPVYTHEMGTSEVAQEIKAKAKADWIDIEVKG